MAAAWESVLLRPRAFVEDEVMPELARSIRGSAARRDGAVETGFSLIETLIGMFILTFGLLASGQMLFLALSSQSLARAKGNAAIVAQDQLERLADLYRQNPAHADLTVGAHGPNQVQVTNPVDNAIINRYNVAWTVASIVTNGKTLKARQATVTVTPIGNTGTSANLRVGLNKVVSVSGIFSARMP